jgi:class 3 adenylate cyclase
MDAVSAAAAGTAHTFVGRATERALLRHLLRDAGESRPAMVVVSGAPGAGKTALLEWTAAAARGMGIDVLRTSCYESSLPFAALRRLVDPLPELARAVGALDVGAADAPIDLATASGLARRLIDALVARARRRPQALLLDDAQDLGDASRTVLDDALAGLDDAGARHGLPLFVMLTERAPVEADGLAQHVLRLAAARAVTLEGFDDAEVLEFLAASGQRAQPSVVRELLEGTGGLPLLVESEVQRWRARGERRDRRGPTRTADARVRSIADALELRFDRVDPPTLRLLQQAAVLGEPWSPAELAVIADRSTDEIDAMTAAAEKARLVIRGGQDVRFAHPLVRSELLDRLPEDRRGALHRTIAAQLRASLDASGRLDDEALVRVADHLLRAGPDVPRRDIADATLQAGRIAMGWTAWDQASRFLAAAAEASVGMHPAGELARRHLEAGRAAYHNHDADLAESVLARAISYARQAGEDGVRLTAAMLLARMRGARRLRPWDRVDLAELRDALRDGLDVEPAVRVMAEAALAEGLVNEGEVEHAARVLASARLAIEAMNPGPAAEDALGRVGFAAGLGPMILLDVHAADASFASGLPHAIAAGNALNETLARSRLALLGLLRGTVRAAHAELVAVERRASAEGFWGEVGLTAALLAFADGLAGRPEAVESAERAYRAWRRTGNPWNAAILSAVVPALAARSVAPDRTVRDPSSLWARRTGLPAPSTMRALAAVESYDLPAARDVVATARWRQGLHGPVTLNNTAIPAALVEAGDLVGDGAMVRAGVAALEHMYERGVSVTLPWPATVPRLLAAGARHAGELDRAQRYAEIASGLADREDLAPERAKCLLELARVAGARGPGGRSDAESWMAAAVRAFDEQLLRGWVARCDEVGRQLGLPPSVGSSGVIRERTILTSDIVGSTMSNVRLGDVIYLEQLRVHDRIVRARVREFRGVEIKHTGDGLNATFDDPADAVGCALAMMVDFRDWKADEPELALEIRCGLSHGRLLPSGGDFFGLVQSEAARLCGLAGPGEVLASATVVAAVGPDVHAESLGRRTLRGLPSRTEVFRLGRA